MRKFRIYQILLLFIFFSGLFQIALAQPGSDIVLARGNPPLTQSMVFKSIDLLEWSLDIHFPTEQKSKIQQILVNAWASNNRAQIQSTLEVVDIQTKLSEMAPSERNNFKERFKLIILENLRKNPNDDLSQTVLTALQQTNQNTKTPDTVAGNNQTIEEDKFPNVAVTQKQTNSSSQDDSEKLWTLSQSAPLTTEQATAILQKSTFVNTAVTDKSLTFEQAIANVRKFLNDGVGSKAVADFYASPEAKNADSVAAIAAGAMMRGLPTLAVAALLRAQELESQEATHLVNLAAVLSYIGMSHEALAILDSSIVKNGEIASPLGMGGKAGALNIRGFALIKLGRAKEAEDALRQAVAQSPHLDEAKTNLAFALWAQDDPNKKKEGVGLIAAVWRRNIPTRNYDITGKIGDPIKSESEDEIPIEIFESNLDLSKGKRLYLPDLKTPTSLEASAAMSPKYQDLMRMIAALIKKRIARKDELWEIMDKRLQKDLERAGESNNPLAAVNSVDRRRQKFEDLLELIDIEKARQHPAVLPFWEKAHKAYVNSYQGVHFDQRWLIQVPGGTSDPGSQADQWGKKMREIDEAQRAEGFAGYAKGGKEKYNRMRCEATRQAHTKWHPALDNYDAALRDYLQAVYKHMTAVIANISDPIEQEIAFLRIEVQIFNEWHHLVMYTDSFSPAKIALESYCKSPSKETKAEIGELNMYGEKPDPCSREFKGKNKFSIDIPIVSLSFNCESIGMEFSNTFSWLSPYLEFEAKFKGGWISQYQGVKIAGGIKLKNPKIPGHGIAGIKPGVSVKAGGFVELNSEGKVLDYGFKGSATASVSAGQTVIEDLGIAGGVKIGVGDEFSIIPYVDAVLNEDFGI